VAGAGVEVGLGVTAGRFTGAVAAGVGVGAVITWPQPHSNSAITDRDREMKRVLIFITPQREILDKPIIPDRRQIGKNRPCQIKEIVLHLWVTDESGRAM